MQKGACQKLLGNIQSFVLMILVMGCSGSGSVHGESEVPVQNNLQVRCEMREGNRAIQFVTYDGQEQPRLSAHVGGIPHFEGIRHVEGISNTWVIKNSKTIGLYKELLCSLSILPPGKAVIFPANAFPGSATTGSEFASQVRLLTKQAVFYSTYIAYDGSDWYLNAVYAVGEESNPRHQLGNYRLSTWITTRITSTDGNLIAEQVAASQDNLDRFSDGRYLPLPAYSLFIMNAYGLAPTYNTKKYGTYPELNPVVARRLISMDFGHSWKLLEWKRLQNDIAPGVTELTFVKRSTP
jgi:hypothetical protein